MREEIFTVKSNKQIARDIFMMKLAGDIFEISAPGQFVNIKLDGKFLRRPISICDADNGELTLIYKTVGGGTLEMSNMTAGKELNILLPLGNGFDTSVSGDSPVLIGGGVGTPPMYMLCKKLISENKNVTVALGFNSSDDVILTKEFEELGAKVYTATADGTYGIKGFVTDIIKDTDYSFFYACGPMPMFKAISKIAKTAGQYSFEERMGCGFGACMGCTCKTLTGNKRICREGPVMRSEEIIWDD